MQRFLEALKYIDDCGLTLIQFLILSEASSENSDPRHLAGIANHLHRTPAAMTPAADFLFKKGFAEREVGPFDRRKLCLKTTSEGENILTRVKQILAN